METYYSKGQSPVLFANFVACCIMISTYEYLIPGMLYKASSIAPITEALIRFYQYSSSLGDGM